MELYKQGFSDEEIALKLGCSRSNITIRLNKKGYTNRKSKIDNLKLRNQISNSLRRTCLGSENANYKSVDEIEADNEIQYYKRRARGLSRTFARDKLRNSEHRCEICGSKTDVLEVHHKKPFKSIFNEFLENHFSGNRESFSKEILEYQDFINMDNLIIVCPTCHKEIHHFKDNPKLSQYIILESSTTIESIGREPISTEEASRVESSDSKCEDS